MGGGWGPNERVNDDAGTAYKERIPGIDVAGKTGTAQVSHRRVRGSDDTRTWFFNRDHAWFAGYAPASAPDPVPVISTARP